MSQGLIVANILIGALLPHLVAILSQMKWSATARSAFAFGACLVAAAVSTYVAGDLTLENWTIAAGTVYALARTTYSGLWKPTGITDGIEQKTEIGGPDGN